MMPRPGVFPWQPCRCATSSGIAVRTTRACASATASALGMRRLSIIDLVDRPAADSQRGRHRLGRLQRRDLQLPRAARRARSAPGIASTPPPTPRSSSTPTRSGASDAFARLRGMFGIALWDRADAGAVARARSRRHQAAALRAARRPAVLRLRDQVAAGGAGVAARARSRRARPLPVVPLHAARRARSSSGIRKLPPGHLPALAATAARDRRYWELPAEETFTRLGGRRRASAATRCWPTRCGRTGQRRAARGVPVRRRRLEPRRRADGAGVEPAGQDVLDRLRRAGVRRARRTRARVAEHFGTDHHEFVVRPDALGIVDG